MTHAELREAVVRALNDHRDRPADELAALVLYVVREAMREPTVGMIEAWRQTWATSNPKIEWRAMLAASPLGGGDE